VAARRRLVAIVFTDISGYTSLAQSNERAALALIEAQDELVRPLLRAHRGRKVKGIGDGLLLEFPNALDAVEFALAFQRATRDRGRADGTPELRVRIGIHLGDVERRGTDILGDSVNVASRLEPLADPGGICLSASVHELVRHKISAPIERLGARTLKGVREPVEVYRIAPGPPGATTAASGALPPRLAVLPLSNISPDPHDEYLADGLTEELTSVLSQIRGLRVIARTSVNQYKGTTKSVGQIGAELGVASLLEGSVRKSGDQLRISMQLIDVRSEEHRWTETYDRRLENIFAIQAEVAERTAAALKVELLQPERAALGERPTSNLAAYEAYLRGIEAYHRREPGPDPYFRTKSYFETALREDPDLAPAHAYLANILIGTLGQSAAARDVAPAARSHIARALALSPNSSEAHAAAGNLAVQVDLDWPRAEAEFQLAIELGPSNANAHFWYGFLLTCLQRLEEAESHLRSAIELDPLWANPRVNLAGVLCVSGKSAPAIELVREAQAAFGPSPLLEAQLAFCYLFAGRWNEALRLAEGLAEAPGWYAQGGRAMMLAWLGKPEAAREILRGWERHELTGYVPLGVIAELYGVLGDPDRALATAERDLTEGDRTFWNYYQSPAFESLWDDPRFVRLLNSVHLPTTRPKGQMPRPDGAGPRAR
jgi:adenylate cyclase